MISTFTLNPTLDKIITVDGFRMGEVLSVRKTSEVAGGKGINVARVLKQLGSEVTVSALVGGVTGSLLAELLKQEGMSTALVTVAGRTRSNLTILDGKTGEETHLRETGPQVTEEELALFKETFTSLLQESEFIVLAGSLPPGMPGSTYAELISLARAKGVKAILDSRNEALLSGINARPFMVKANRSEMEEIAGGALGSEEEMVAAARSPIEGGIEVVVISLGKDGAIALTREGVWKAPSPEVKAVNSVGSGDALVAGFIHAHTQGRGWGDCLRLGVACGAANAMISGAGLCRSDDIASLYEQIEVRSG